MTAANPGKDVSKGARNTPGRRGRTGNQYFDVGKVGRKTGIVLKDTGVRDERGMEPMAGIFSSPASPPKRAQATSSSNAMELQESTFAAIPLRISSDVDYEKANQGRFIGSAPDVDETLHMRKTPRLPPPRATTPRHTNIGSPKRMSSARPQSRNAEGPMASEASPNRCASQPPANRVLNFNKQAARMGADTGSPFKPKRVLRRSFGGAARREQFEDGSRSSIDRDSRSELPNATTDIIEEDDMEEFNEPETEAGAEAVLDKQQRQQSVEQQQLDDQFANDGPIMFNNDDDFYDAERESHDAEITEALQHAEVLLQTTPTAMASAKRGRGRPRKSGESSLVQNTPQTAQTTLSSRKRDRTEIEEDDANQTLQSIEQTDNDISQISTTSENTAKRRRGRPRKSENTVLQDQNEVNDDEVSQISATAQNPPKRRPGRPRKSDISVLQDPIERTIAEEGDDTHQSIEQDDNEISQISATPNESASKRRGRPRKSDVTVVQDGSEHTIDPALLAHGDSYLAPVNEDDEVEVAPASPVTKKKGGRKPKAQKATQSQRAPKERDPNQSMHRATSGSPGKANDRDLALNRSPSKRGGSVSNVALRASTPFEDAHQRMSRSGRPILKPLKHWAGESYVWKNGEVEGIIRADEVKTPGGGKKKKAKSRRRVPRAGGRGASNDLDSIAEESDTESTVPDDWEEQVGVIAGTVAAWDPDAQQGNPEAPIREDIAFAKSSILTRDVAGLSFKYAKIMTLPFFGSGIVELPPNGFKRAKNSRKMQMVFFVHDGKVLVTVGPPAVEQNGRGVSGSDSETNEFAISKGGVWVVPRGNNYSISNESGTKSARIFFAQGCEVEPEMASQQ